EVHGASPWMELVHDYPGQRVRLDVWLVERWSGEPQGLEGQPLRWVPVDELADIGLLPADRPILDALVARHAARPGRCRVPFCDRRLAASTPAISGEREDEAHVVVDLHGALVDPLPFDEAHVEAVLSGADFREDPAVRRHQHAHEIELLGPRQAVLIEAAGRDALDRLRRLAREP